MHRALRRLMTAGAVVATLGTLAACGEDTSDVYCERLEQVSGPFADLRAGEMSQIDQVMDDLAEVEKLAPEEIAGQWSTFAGTIGELRAAVADQGLTVAELFEISQQPQISSEDQERLEAVDEAMAGVDLMALDEASRAISVHAEQACELSLEEASSE